MSFPNVVNRVKVVSASIAALTALACSNGGPDLRSTVRDSAGVQIVDSYEGTWRGENPIRPADELLVELGASPGGDGEAEPLFQVAPIRWINPERFVLVNSRTEIRIYDLRGNLINRLGGEGEGPGEYRRISGLAPLSDGRLVVADGGLRRLTILDSVGRVERVVRIQAALPISQALVGDRWIVGLAVGDRRADGPRIGRILDSVVAISLETGEREVWATSPGARVIWRSLPNGLPAILGLSLSPESILAGRGDRLVFGSSDAYELKELDAHGDLVRILRRHIAARPVTETHKKPFLDAWRDRGEPPYATPEFADSLPHFKDILLDDAGRTWVQINEGEDRAAPEWDIFDPAGSFLYRITLPDGFLPQDIIEGQVVGVWRDSLNVEYVQIRRLVLPRTTEG